MYKDKTLKLLSDFISIPSISADPSRRKDIIAASKLLKKELEIMGCRVIIDEHDGASPLVIGHYSVSSLAPTIGIYGHYDVQPEDPIDEWNTPPFVLTLKNGKLYGRGVADNKGHIIQNLTSIKHLIKVGALKNNILFFIEGEEESSSANLEQYVSKEKNLLSKVNAWYVTDVGMRAKNIPQIFYALRGLLYFEIGVEIGSRDLHSGIYGNRVLNPIQALSDLFAKMKNIHTGRILIPHFSDNVRVLDQEELNLLDRIKRTDKEEKKKAGVYRVVSLDKERPWLSSKIYPSMDVHGIIGGYSGEGAKTVIPRKAKAKFSFRLVENQDPEELESLIKAFIKKNIPKGVKYTLTTLSKDNPFYTEVSNPWVQRTSTILSEVFGNETLLNRTGGSVPAAEILQRHFRKPIVLTGFTLPDDNIHSPNENFDEEMFWKGIEALIKIYSGFP